jgi:PAS domain S-box-containing protein
MAVVLAIGVLPISVGAVVLQRRDAAAGARDALDRALVTGANEQAGALESYFARARAIDLLTAQNPAFREFYDLPGSRVAKIRAGGPVLEQTSQALAYLEQLFPGSIGEACFIDRGGPENARVVRGERALPSELSPDESKNPFFAPTFALRAGQVYQARPYVSPDTGEWVISNSTLLPTADGSKPAIVHFEVTIESFRRAAARDKRFEVTVVDGRTGAVVFDSRVPQRKGAPLGRPRDRRFAAVVESGAASGVLRIGDVRAAFQRLRPRVGNANDWYVVAATKPVAASSRGFSLTPFAVLAALLVLLAFTLARRWVRVHERIEVERRRSEDDLRESEERYRELFENANDAIATLDLEGRITSANKALECISGYPRDELVGKRLAELLAGESQDLTPERSALEVELVACDGRTTTLEVGFRPIEKDGVHVGTQLIARDVSERRRLEEQLRQSQKMEAIGQLAGGVAHDFNNLLLAISGYTQLALDRVNGDAALGGHLREVSRAADRAAGLTRQLLAFSRKQILQPRVFDLNAVVADMNDMLRRLIGEHIELVTALDPALAPVEADVGQIEQVLMNLAVNARDAMPAGGTLTISTASIGTSSVQFAIADTGCGMDAATREKAFEPFFTTKDPGKGTGLGLSTVYGIVEQSGGQVTIESEPGRGTTFRVALPATGRGVENGAAAAPIESSGSETILLVEDEDVVASSPVRCSSATATRSSLRATRTKR